MPFEMNERTEREREREWVNERLFARTGSALETVCPNVRSDDFFPDDIELDAQVSAKVSPGAGQRHLEASLLHVQELRFQGDGIHRGDRLSEREGEPFLTSPRHFHQGREGNPLVRPNYGHPRREGSFARMGIDLLLLLSTREGGREGGKRTRDDKKVSRWKSSSGDFLRFMGNFFFFFFLEFGEKEVSIDSTYRYRID